MTICFDLDGTLCTHRRDGRYELAEPIPSRIDRVRRLHEEGVRIVINTARGSETGIDWYDVTAAQLDDWGVPCDVLLVGVKPPADLYIDDRAKNALDFFCAEPSVFLRGN